MAEKRATTLLQCAIAAAAAVVPVLLSVLLAVGVTHPVALSVASSRNADRHVSVRHLAALKTFERAIVRRSSVQVGPPSAPLLLDRLPQCRGAWDGHGGVLDRARRALARPGAPPPSPAQRVAAQLTDLDDALLRCSAAGHPPISQRV